ncbi:MAG: signal recognition particle-docking protein FtsY [Ignavibacteria bacterium]|nr:signal recognition particle-docking protein FtsY [Ignavibacteria bacterium]OIO23620.1 MAG: signal recognition particle-docking protein FtsY [Ignavibacteria bacterium CG1_02_37_35]PIS46092.1 MAG: signal recognition particle-docking protein FtsY [Ignavibacteria bacterium CG08_land_8_20_14_0_20_37_9]PIX92839.1 MAG: signal recognition particle-docking protein FtsY [Ignavibacteria bacterium CG_4_10_14_3_um_filter_37_18]PJC61199.1 MAG: signal recognition particle-docking protein FtsY [Ignavibacter
MNLFKNINIDKLTSGLSKTRSAIFNRISEVITGKVKLEDEVFSELEEILITADVGVDLSLHIIGEIKKKMVVETLRNDESIRRVLKDTLIEVLNHTTARLEFEPDFDNYKPFVILIVGVNGAGKTTTVGKMAHNFCQAGQKVVIGAADTFRAAANEQLAIWAKRANVSIVQKESGSDPSSVVFETVKKAIDEKIDVVIIDTAGRLHTKTNLMEELSKIRRVIKKLLNYAPNETFLVVDGNNGQNAIQQAKTFSKSVELTGLIITKLDGTAKGGIVFQMAKELKLMIPYIGVGEGINDLQYFDSKIFVNSLVGSN